MEEKLNIKVIRLARHYFLRMNFSPSLLGVFTNPFWLCRRELYLSLKKLAPLMAGRILDFGAGSQPYRELLINCSEYVSLEYDTPQNRMHKVASIFYSGRNIPVADKSFDGILSTQTLEHVPNPHAIVAEWARVIKADGLLLITVPFMWPEHELPYDYQRFSSNGLKLLLENYGFAIVEQQRLLADCRAPAQLLLAWVYDAALVKIRPKILRFCLIPFLCTPVSLLFLFLSVVAPTTSNTYLDNLILARRTGNV